ncbi:MAG: hypothetical protein FWF56_05615 [Firmicutes bacterium]|nr:hypothetical protein [Bacillota bacterium]MCL1953714.1 hypothetical protein [Bacillota bacterium]
MKCTRVSFFIVSSIVGAGFASGRELIAFYGSGLGFWVVPLVGFLVFVVSLLFLRVGAKLQRLKCDNNYVEMFGRGAVGVEIFGVFNSFVVLAVMLAGLTVISGSISGIPVVAIVLSLVAVFVLRYGIGGLMRANSILVPILLIVLIAICVVAINSTSLNIDFAIVLLPKSVVYVSLNMYLASQALYKLELNTKQSIISSFLAGILVSVLLYLLISAIVSYPESINYPMPLLYIANRFGNVWYFVVSSALGLCIFSSLLIALYNIIEWLSSFVKDRILAGMIALTCAFALSMIGFEKIVQAVYPIIGVVGVLYICANCWYLATNRVKIRQKDKAIV